MPNVNGQFQGETLVIPGAYYADEVGAPITANNPATPPLVFLGYGYGVKPFTPTDFSSPTDLLNALRGGPCSGYVQFLTSPSPSLNGAQVITYINVGNNTQSTYTVSAGVTGVVTFTSANYGLPSNQMEVQVATGTITGKNISIYDSYANQLITGTNLGVPFRVAYTGTATGVTYTVATSGSSAVTFSTTGGNAGENVSISLLPANFGTVQSVIQYLNGTGFYSAIGISTSGGDLPSSSLDAASTIALAPPSGGVNQQVNVTATLGDIVYWCNQFAQSLATAALASGVTSTTALAPTNIPFTLFTGATSVAPTQSSYASGFNAALGIAGWTVFADSNSSGVVALGTQHAITASQPNSGKWRRFFTGSSIADSINTAVGAAQAQGAITTCYVYPGITRTDNATGVNTLFGGLYAAAAAAGMATGNTVATPLTNKPLTGNGVEVQLTVAQINQLQQAGVMCIYKSPATGQPTIISDLTTWQSDNSPENVFTQQVACRWQLAYLLTSSLQQYAGTIAATLTETNILNQVKASLNAAVYSQSNQNGVIDDWDANSLVLTFNGTTQTAAVTVNVTLVGQNRFITMLVNAQLFNATFKQTIFGQV